MVDIKLLLYSDAREQFFSYLKVCPKFGHSFKHKKQQLPAKNDLKFAEKGDGDPLRHPHCFLLSDTQLGDQGTIALDVLLHQVVEQAAALTDHLQQTTVGVLVLGVGAHVLGEDVDALGEDSDLNLRGAGVGFMGAVGLDHGRLLIFTKHSVVPPF